MNDDLFRRALAALREWRAGTARLEDLQRGVVLADLLAAAGKKRRRRTTLKPKSWTWNW